MSEYAVITQNDESKWEDIKGELYNYPKPQHAATPGAHHERASHHGRRLLTD